MTETTSEERVNQLQRFLVYSSIFTILVATTVLFGWIIGYEPILSLIPGAATMKANTASGFILLGITGLFFNGTSNISKIAVKVAASLVALIALSTLSEYLFGISLNLDTLIVEDSYSTITRNRMSPATALCFGLGSIGTLIYHKNNARIRLAQYMWLLITLAAFISIVTYILNIPATQKTELFSSMAIHTSILFLVMSLALFFQTSSLGLAALIMGPLPGSKITRQLLPFTILLPVFLSYLFFYLSVNSTINIPSSFWVIINTISLILLSIVYICIMAVGLNKSAKTQQKLQNTLRSSNRTLRAFKKAIDKTSLVTELDANGEILTVNNNFSKLTGFKKQEIKGKKYNSLLLNDRITGAILKSLKSYGLWEGEIQRKGKKGKHWVYSTIIEHEESNGNSKYLMVEQDISERKETEKLKDVQFITKLQQKNQELEQFLYIASHDLQEPLRSIRSMLQILKMELGDKLTESTTEFMDLMEGSADRMSDLVKGLMDYARLGNKKELANIDLNQLMIEVKADLKSLTDNNRATVNVANLPTLDVHPVETRLLFQNLLSNAIKFKKPDTAPIIDVSATEQEGFWQFKVQDNGIGIKKEHQKKIFIIFQRLNKRDEYEGTGIGLAHCMKIVSLHGGELWVESEPGEGSTFYFTLPKKQFNVTK